MINTSHKIPTPEPELYLFLRKEFSLTEKAIDLGIKQSQLESAPLAITMLNLGLISLSQYQELLQWIYD